MDRACNVTPTELVLSPKERRAHALRKANAILVSVLVCAYAFLLPIDFGLQVLFSLTLWLIVGTLLLLSPSTAYHVKLKMAHDWHYELTNRFALDQIAAQAREIDWDAAWAKAADSIKDGTNRARFDDELFRNKPVALLGWFVSFVAGMLFVPLLGWGVARLIESYFPRLAFALVAGHFL